MTDYRPLFHNLRPLFAPFGLKAAIIACIRFEERSRARRNVALFAPILLASLAGIAWGVSLALPALASSGFAQYVSLLFSDPTIIGSAWFPYVLSIVESLPIFALTVLVGAALGLIISGTALKNARRAFSFA